LRRAHVLYKEPPQRFPLRPSTQENSLTMLRRMLEAADSCRPETWSGPEDGTLAGNLECDGGVEISVHVESGGLHLDVWVLHDTDIPNRGGQIGTVVDARMDTGRFLNVDADTAHGMAISIIRTWIAEMESIAADDESTTITDCYRAANEAALIFAAATISTGAKKSEFMVRIEHPTPFGPGWICGSDGGSREWTVDDRTLDVCRAGLPMATVYEAEGREPGILRIQAKSWMPDWHGPDDVIGTMRVLERHAISHVVELVPQA
jgi:hypothetical protein